MAVNVDAHGFVPLLLWCFFCFGFPWLVVIVYRVCSSCVKLFWKYFSSVA